MTQDTQSSTSATHPLLKYLNKIPFSLKIVAFLLVGFTFGFQWASLIFFSVFFVAYSLKYGAIAKAKDVYSKLTPVILLQNMVVISATFAALDFLSSFEPLHWSFLSLFNIPATNLGVSGNTVTGWGLIFIALLVVVIPSFAEFEEKIFRATTLPREIESELIRQKKLWWFPRKDLRVEFNKDNPYAFYASLQLLWSTSGWAFRSLIFGLAHMLSGVPLYAGLTLALPGLWFSHQYMKSGLERSTLHHTAYNLIAVSVMLFSQWQALFG